MLAACCFWAKMLPLGCPSFLGIMGLVDVMPTSGLPALLAACCL